MDEAIELAIEGRSPYPDNATFIDADAVWAGEAIRKAVDDGRAVVLALCGRQHAGSARGAGFSVAVGHASRASAAGFCS
jgi:hypothetical protein